MWEKGGMKALADSSLSGPPYLAMASRQSQSRSVESAALQQNHSAMPGNWL